MSNEDNLFGMEDLDDTRATFEELRAMPMSVPAKSPKRKAKYNFMQLPKEAVHCVKVYDRYGVEQKDVIEFDPETFEGVRMKDGSQQKIYLFNGYIEAAGVDQPDEEQLPEIIENVRKEVIPQARGRLYSASVSSADGLKTRLGENTPQGLKCPKCQSGIRFDDDQKAIVCSNGACDMKWHIDGGVGQG
jgi:hypothetical protein